MSPLQRDLRATMRSIRHAALASLGLLALAAPIHGEEFVDGIAAQVGTDIVLASEVERFAAPVEIKLHDSGAPESEIVKMRAEILERMIERRLIEQAVRRIEIDATEVEIDTAIAAIANETGLTMDQLQRTVEAKGMSYEAYRDQIRGEIQRQKLISATRASPRAARRCGCATSWFPSVTARTPRRPRRAQWPRGRGRR